MPCTTENPCIAQESGSIGVSSHGAAVGDQGKCNRSQCSTVSSTCWLCHQLHAPGSLRQPRCAADTAQILRDWSAKGIVQRLDRRRLQHELDTHKLFLLTSYDRESHGALVA